MVIKAHLVEPPPVDYGNGLVYYVPGAWRFTVDGRPVRDLELDLDTALDTPVKILVRGNRVLAPTELHVDGRLVAFDRGLLDEIREPR